MNLTETKKEQAGKIFYCLRVFIYLCMLLIPSGLLAQAGIVVKGQVTDLNGPMTGVIIVVQGTNNYASTDADGNYSITVNDENPVLSFSYIGYKTVNEPVAGRTLINIVMEEDIAVLTESVVVGYGQMKRSDLTGSVVSVSADAITKSVVTSIDQVLNRAAGVQITQNSGMPGASTSIRIRGINSLNASNEPIYVIDGAIIDGGSANGNNNTNTNAIAFINPADIVSIDILKDASATAIYGSRASNGVIIITTKRGQKGDASVSYNGYLGWQQIPGKLDVLNLREYAVHRNTLAELGIAQWNNNFVRPDLLGEGTDWQDELFTSAFMHSHNISISGGSEKNTYAMTAGYLNQDGIAIGSGFKRLNLTGNFDAQVKNFLKAGVNFAFSNSNQKLTVSDQSLISTAIRTTPDVPVRNADGSFAGTEEQFMPRNPMALASLVDNRNETTGIRGNTYLEATILEGLTVRTELSFNYGITSTYRFQPTYYLSATQFEDNNQGEYSKQYNKYWNWHNVINYNKKFGVHSVNVMLGQEMQKSSWDYLSGSRTGFTTNGATDLTLGDATTAANNGYTDASALLSFFGRIFYSFDDKYLLTTTLRRDGSSKFAKENRWGWYPSAALAWKISNEKFFENTEFLNSIDNMKLRLGWGLVGNQNIPDNYAYISTYRTVPTNMGTGLLASNTPNKYLKWEITTSTNIGLDLNLFKNRIEFIADFYYKKTKNLLMQASLPVFSGTSGTGASGRPWVNLGSLRNQGIELTLNTVNINTKDFLWRSSITFSSNRNKVLSINTETGTDPRSIADPEGGTTTITQTVVGQPIGQFYGYQIIGRFEKPTDFYYKDADGNIQRTPVMFDLPIDEINGVWIGDFIYADRNADGKIDENDLTIIGNPEPKFTFGISNTFTYKNWDLTVFLTGSVGNKAVNYMRRWMENPRRNISNLFSKATRYAQVGLIDPSGPEDDYRNLHIVGGDSDMPRIPRSTLASDYDFAFSDRYVEDASYLRIQNISLGYTLPGRLTNKFGVQTVKLYVNLQNVYTFTDYSGYDAEIGISYSNGYQLNGVDFGRYPSPRIYTFGINITF
ncbi:MAG: TonB-dependent receptor [Prevotellaceae bacterium]|jgi:TonB-linked SusC/RagA family outer membrane protein|nr:TonB-dependent receptor [Prevotellaceae bacterium]